MLSLSLFANVTLLVTSSIHVGLEDYSPKVQVLACVNTCVINMTTIGKGITNSCS
jgi:hypothetical protein